MLEIGDVKKMASEAISGHVSGLGTFHEIYKRLNGYSAKEDDPGTKVTKRIVLFVTLFFTMSYFSYLGLLLNGLGFLTNGALVLFCQLTEQKSIFGYNKNELLNRVKACAIQGICMDFATGFISPFLFSAACTAYPAGLEKLQDLVNRGIQYVEKPDGSFLDHFGIGNVS